MTEISEKRLDENGILHIKYFEGAIIDLPALIKSKEDNAKLLDGKKELVLCDARMSFTLTPDAQRYARKEIINKSRVATAVVTNKGFIRLIVNFTLQFFKLKSSLKIFSKEQEALVWLHSFILSSKK